MAHADTMFDTVLSVLPEGFAARLRKRFADYTLYQRTLAELQALSARDLDDLNIDRYDLRGTARRAVYGV